MVDSMRAFFKVIWKACKMIKKVEGRWRDGGGTVEVIVEVEESAVRIFIVIRCCVLRIACSRCSVYECEKGSAY